MQSTADIEPATISDILGLATWDRMRSSEELRTFVDVKHALNPEMLDI